MLVLEAAQQRRKVSAPLRLAATALYSLLGAPSLGERRVLLLALPAGLSCGAAAAGVVHGLYPVQPAGVAPSR